MYKLNGGAVSRRKAIYLNVPYMIDLSFNSCDFYAVDIHITHLGISVVGDWYTISHPKLQSNHSSLEHSFNNLHPALQEICGTLHFPPDNGHALMEEIQHSSGKIFGASDASLKSGRATHAWIISPGKKDDINNPLLHISGPGMVHGNPNYLSSARGELQGITAMSIICNMLSRHHNRQTKLSAICDNVGVINKCTKGKFSSLRRNRDANIDLYLTYKEQKLLSHTKLSWVGGHSDKKPWQTFHDLKSLKLSCEETYNVWCDRIAQKTWELGQAPSERWAVYS
jgi:hypothetical protein